VAERAGKAAAAKVAALTAAGKIKAEEGTRGGVPGQARRASEIKKPAAPVRREEPRRRGKLTVSRALSAEEGERMRSLASVRRMREKLHRQHETTEQQKIVREVVVPENITVQELANRMAERGADVIKSLMRMGVMATINQSIDADTAELLVTEFGHKLKRVSEADVEIGLKGDADVADALQPRPPVVTIMGHVGPRQDVAPRRHPPDRRRGRRGGGHHPAYRRLPGRAERRPAHHLHRHARPPGLHRDARARRQRHRHRRARRRRR